jgi:hypothetical protein
MLGLSVDELGGNRENMRGILFLYSRRVELPCASLPIVLLTLTQFPLSIIGKEEYVENDF